jgi:hypothetical protein
MARALVIALIIALPLMAVCQSQDVVKVNILEIAGKTPTPPADVKDAYSRTTEVKREGDVTPHRESAPFYKPVKDKLETANQQIGKAIELLSKPQMDAAKEMDQKEMQKKFKSMSKDEQMKMAMDMAKKMGMGPKVMTRESDDVMAATQECLTLNQAVATDVQSYQKNYEARQKIDLDRDAKHKEVDNWAEQESKKLPQVNYGEMSGPEPKAQYALNIKAMNKHLAVENEYLKTIQKEWKTTWEKYNARYSPLQDKLAKIHYGEDAKNPETKRQLLSGQMQMVSAAAELVGLSSKATEGAAYWWQKKLDLEKDKPKD